MPPRYRKVDSNQKKVVAKLREMGYDVVSIAVVGDNVPDLIVGKNGLNLLVELKSDKKKLRPGQAEFFSNWQGYTILAHNADEIISEFERYVAYLKRKLIIFESD